MPRSITHASFTITRHWKHAPSRVFEAFAKEDPKYFGLVEEVFKPPAGMDRLP